MTHEPTDPGSIKAQVYGLHLLLEEMREQNEAAHNRIKSSLDSVVSTLNGNGKPGLCARMHVQETKTGALVFVAASLVAALVTVLVTGLAGT